MRITIDRNRCQGLGLCALNAPELFTLNDDGTVDYTADVPTDLRGLALEAARNCPTAAITTAQSS